MTPRIQVALATGKLVLPEQGCLGQGGCEAKPDYEGVKPNAHDPVRNRITFKIRAMIGTDFFLFWAMRQDFTQIYGQTGIFEPFVRNRYFSGGPFTDKEPIFIDLSVNGSDFAKCSAAHHLLNRCT